MKKENFFFKATLLGIFVFLVGLLVFFYSKIQFIELKVDSKIQNQD